MRILRVVTRPNVGGPMRQALALWHAHRALGVRTLLVVGVCDDDESALPLAGGGPPLLELDAALRAGRDADGICVLDALRRRVAPLRDVAALRALARLIASFAPDVVHTHTSKAGWLGRLAAHRRRVPVIAHTFHGLVLSDYAGPFRSWTLRRIERWFAARSDLLVAVSESCRAELATLRVARDVRVIPPAVATAAFARADKIAARRALDLPPDALVLGCIGRMVGIKRPALFAELLTRVPTAIGVALGDGPERATLRAAAAQLGGRLRILPTTPDPAAIVAAIDLLVIPSRREGFPIVGVEAAAAGVPTLGFDVPGVRDLAAACGGPDPAPESEGVPGLAVRVRAFDAAGRPRLADRAAELVRACEPARVAEALLEAYEAALGRST
ncbi:MAG: glycosyltransferase [Planctomycetes bacterium]|nr:glycosyltransferase [Planctomycetota bacterium]